MAQAAGVAPSISPDARYAGRWEPTAVLLGAGFACSAGVVSVAWGPMVAAVLRSVPLLTALSVDAFG